MVDEKKRDFSAIVDEQKTLEDRIAATDAGIRFLNRVRDIGRPRGPYSEGEDKQGE